MGSGDDDGAAGTGVAGSAAFGADGAAQGVAGAAAAGGSGVASGRASSSEVASGHEFRATGDPVAFQVLAKRFLGPVVGQVRQAHAAGGTGVKNLDREIRE